MVSKPDVHITTSDQLNDKKHGEMFELYYKEERGGGGDVNLSPASRDILPTLTSRRSLAPTRSSSERSPSGSTPPRRGRDGFSGVLEGWVELCEVWFAVLWRRCVDGWQTCWRLLK